MNYFSYNDYVDYVENGKIDKITKVREDEEKYIIINDKEEQYIQILKNKQRIINFLNKFIKFSEPIIYKNIKLYRNIEIEKNNAILYKINGREIFILIKLIHKKDYNLPYKILNYSVKIMKRWEEIKNKENLRYPIVIPIIIYTGNEEWKIINKKVRYITYDKNRINLYYNIYKYEEFIEFSN